MDHCRRSSGTNQALPQDEGGDAATPTSSADDFFDLAASLAAALTFRVVPCLVFAGSVVYAVVLAIQGDPGWWRMPLMGMAAAAVATLVTYFALGLVKFVTLFVLMLGFGLRWLLCYGGICRLGRATVNAVRSATSRRRQKPSSEDMILSCFLVFFCLFWNGITWSMVFSFCFIPNGSGGGYSWDPEFPMGLLLFFLPFMLIAISLILGVIFAGPLYHLSYYLLCCWWFETGTAAAISLDTAIPLDTEMAKQEKDDDDETVATVATDRHDESTSMLHGVV